MRRVGARTPATAGLLLGVVLFACGDDSGGRSGTAPPGDLAADLRADSNRDGDVRFDDDSDAIKTEWNQAHGAIFLANIDDDSERCRVTSSDDDTSIAACNDAEDEIVNGEDDAEDLARLKTRPLPKAPDDATARISLDTDGARARVRIFRRIGPGPTDFDPIGADTVFTRDDLRAGIELGIEARDIVRDRPVWDGYVDVRFTVSAAGGATSTDVVRMRVAPILTYHHLLPAETIWVSKTRHSGNAALREDLEESCAAAGLRPPSLVADPDQWAQDFFEPAFMSMPGPGGGQHSMRVNYRSANVYEPGERTKPLRPAGRVVFRLRGRNVAGVQQFDIEHPPEMDTLNSFGNLETAPPFVAGGIAYPFGRVVRGLTASFFPDPGFERMLEAQGQQPPVFIDTSWLFVGHVDETISFVRADNARGWVVLANDARLAKKMLEDQVAAGNGRVPMFQSKSWVDLETEETRPAEIAIEDVLADPLVLQASAEAAVAVDGQLAVLRKELALRDDEIVRVPFLHTTIEGRSAAYQPATVNGLYLADDRFAAPDPHGPVIDGKDIFKTALEEPLAALGVRVDFIEDWDAYHVAVGEVHCATNATRKIPEARWWESGR